jgi:hypothetical protein
MQVSFHQRFFESIQNSAWLSQSRANGITHGVLCSLGRRIRSRSGLKEFQGATSSPHLPCLSKLESEDPPGHAVAVMDKSSDGPISSRVYLQSLRCEATVISKLRPLSRV